MGRANKHQADNNRFEKCEICSEYIPIMHYLAKGDLVVCYECGTEYILTSKKPVKLSIAEKRYDTDDYFGDVMFENH